MAGVQVDFTPQGIHLPEIGLWLDPADAVQAAWISHAHSDHARGLHGCIFATRADARLLPPALARGPGRPADA